MTSAVSPQTRTPLQEGGKGAASVYILQYDYDVSHINLTFCHFFFPRIISTSPPRHTYTPSSREREEESIFSRLYKVLFWDRTDPTSTPS